MMMYGISYILLASVGVSCAVVFLRRSSWSCILLVLRGSACLLASVCACSQITGPIALFNIVTYTRMLYQINNFYLQVS